MHFHEYSQVRIRQLIRPPEASKNCIVYVRPPQVGDVGIIVSVYQRPGSAGGYCYTVEFADRGGAPLWLHDFSADELEAAPTQPVP